MIRPARWRHWAPIKGSHSLPFSAPMVNQRSIGIGLGFVNNGFRRFTGMAKPRLAVTVDFIVMMPCTRPWRSRIGPPLLPGSTGMASWSISPNSISRRAERTPSTTLPVRPIGLPKAMTDSPWSSFAESPSESGVRLPSLILRIARSRLRSEACTASTVSSLPSQVRALMARASPMTCRQVAIRSLLMANPVPVPSRVLPRPP